MTRVISKLPARFQSEIAKRVQYANTHVVLDENCDVRELIDSYEVRVNGTRNGRSFVRLIFIPKEDSEE